MFFFYMYCGVSCKLMNIEMNKWTWYRPIFEYHVISFHLLTVNTEKMCKMLKENVEEPRQSGRFVTQETYLKPSRVSDMHTLLQAQTNQWQTYCHKSTWLTFKSRALTNY